jgi:hypothetical protein
MVWSEGQVNGLLNPTSLDSLPDICRQRKGGSVGADGQSKYTFLCRD